jgi:hypothetical protein
MQQRGDNDECFPETSAARVCGGVNWAKGDHAVGVSGAEGRALGCFSVADTTAG